MTEKVEAAIVVTAQKREEKLADLPPSIAVIGSADLAETGKDGLADYVNTIPGLSVASNGPGSSTLAIRGITTGRVRQDEPQNKETVGLYLNDTPVAVNGFNPDIGLFDINRIEVLRGPQGTLYGSGAMGGAIRLVTNRPDPARFEMKAEGTLSATAHGGTDHAIKGMINIPVAPGEFAIRGVAYRSRQSGYIDDIVSRRANVNDAVAQGGRLQMAGKPSAAIDVSATVLVQDLKTGSLSEQFAPYQRGVRAFDGNSDNLKLYSGTMNVDLGDARLTSVTSYIDKRNTNRLSLEFLLSSALGLNSDAPLVDATQVRDFTQEVRLVSAEGGRLDYVVGIFFQHHRRDYRQSAPVPGLDEYVGVSAQDLGTPDPDQIFYGTQYIDQEQLAGFGELNYALSDRLKATVGLRVFKSDEDYRTYSSGLLNGGIDASHGGTADSGANPRIALTYKPREDRLFYLAAARGYRLGGVNTTIPLDLCQTDLDALGRATPANRFGSDSVWNFEVGTRLSSADRKFRINASGYYLKWNDIQTTLSLPSCFFAFRSNAGSARSIGVEIDVTFQPAQRTELLGSLGIMDSRLTEDVPFAGWESGDRVPTVSPVQLNLGIRQAFRVSSRSDGFLRLDYSYVSSTRNNFDKDAASNRYFNGYGLINVALGFNLPTRTPMQFIAFARNLANSTGRTFAAYGNSVAPERYSTLRPRTVGVTLSAEY